MNLRTAAFRAACCCLALLACGQTASAVPLAYDEAISGDLAYPYQTLNLDAGLNSIRGTMTWDITHQFGDFDTFFFVVPEAMELTNFNFTLSPIINGRRRTQASITLYAYPGFVNVASGWLPLFNTTDGLLVSRQPGKGLGAGLYQLFTGGIVQPDGSTFAKFAYQFQLNVASLTPLPDPAPTPTPVPEPATLSLLALGLAGIHARRRAYCSRVASAAPPEPHSWPRGDA
jgi:hypothetical protein